MTRIALCRLSQRLARYATQAPVLQALSSAASRSIATTRVVQLKKNAAEANEALLAQQLLDYMNMDDDAASENPVENLLPLNGVVLDVKNNIASISGLRHATIGSVVTIFPEESHENAVFCRGIVLFLEKKAAQVALFSHDNDLETIRLVQRGMRVELEAHQLEIPASIVKFAGKAVDPLGNPIPLVYANETPEDDEDVSAHERLSIQWGATSVPRFMERGPLQHAFPTGILAIDCLQPLARGHRFGILGPRNSGKTRLALDMIARMVQTSLDATQEPPHFVYVCIGKAPTRVQHILQFLEQSNALPYTTIVSASDRDSVIMQYLAPFAGCAMAEYFMKKKGNAVVIYDDLATHTMVVENLVETMKLPKATRRGLSGHTILMERSAQFTSDRSLTTLAIADAPDTSSGETSDLKEQLVSMVDDTVTLEAPLALQRTYPPIDVLRPGASVRGPPFQSALRWRLMNALRSKINQSCLTKEKVELTKDLGLEVEPEDAEVIEFQDLVRQFFTQTLLQPSLGNNGLLCDIGLFFLNTVRMTQLPPDVQIWEFLAQVNQELEEKHPELLRALGTTSSSAARWNEEIEEQLQRVLLAQMRKERQAYRRKNQSAPQDAMRRALLYRKQQK